MSSFSFSLKKAGVIPEMPVTIARVRVEIGHIVIIIIQVHPNTKFQDVIQEKTAGKNYWILPEWIVKVFIPATCRPGFLVS
jgi:hypothetical protein